MNPQRLFPLIALSLAACGGSLVISPASLPNGAQGTPYLATLTSTGSSPIHWALTAGALPPGLVLGKDSGVVQGTPTKPGTFTFTVQSTESGTLHSNNGTQPYTLTIQPKLVVGSTLPPAQVGQSYRQVVPVSGGVPPYDVNVKGLPAHFTFDPASHAITGMPTFAASYTLEIDVVASGVPQQRAVSKPKLVIKPRQVTITTTSLPYATLNQAYSATLHTQYGAGPFQWSVVSGVLPQGIDLDPSGIIQGTPTAAGTSNFTVQVEDLGSPPESASQALTLTVQ